MTTTFPQKPADRRCWLCSNEASNLEPHLMSRSIFESDECTTEGATGGGVGVWLCVPCHTSVHAWMRSNSTTEHTSAVAVEIMIQRIEKAIWPTKNKLRKGTRR